MIENIEVRAFQTGRVRQASVVRAGRWVFATGLRALGPDGTLDPAVLRASNPLAPPPRAQREAEHIFRGLGSALTRAGSGLDRVVRLDQYYPDWRAVDPYHVARKQALGEVVAPSTSVLVGGLLNTDALMDVQAIATTAESGLQARPMTPQTVGAPRESGYAPCLRVGDLVFVAGQLARDTTGAIATEASVPAGQLWKGTRIQLEAGYLIEHRLRPALEAAGSSLAGVLKAQVYLSHVNDLPAFWQTWSAAFPGGVPPTTVVPVTHPGFGTEAATIEINLVAAADTGLSRVRDVAPRIALPFPGMIPARAFDDLLFVAGLMAVDEGGLAPGMLAPPTIPYYGSDAGLQMEEVRRQAGTIFAAAGTDLRHCVRALCFLPQLSDFPAVHAAWNPAEAAPLSAIQVGPHLGVPAACVLTDLWGYLPPD